MPHRNNVVLCGFLSWCIFLMESSKMKLKIGICFVFLWGNDAFQSYSFDQWLEIFLNNGFEAGIRRSPRYGIEDKIAALQNAFTELAEVLSDEQKKLFVERVGRNGETVRAEED